jgi:hypothetical protein
MAQSKYQKGIAMKRLTCADIITGILLLLVLVGASLFSPSAASTPIFIKWKNSEGIHEGSFDLSDPIKRAEFRNTFKTDSQITACADLADYAVKLMKERDDGTSEGFHLEEVRLSYENTKNDPKGVIEWHVYVDFKRMVRDLHRNSGGQFFFTDPDSYWEREFRWCFISASNWPDSW